jgi:hypothetical protein
MLLIESVIQFSNSGIRRKFYDLQTVAVLGPNVRVDEVKRQIDKIQRSHRVVPLHEEREAFISGILRVSLPAQRKHSQLLA